MASARAGKMGCSNSDIECLQCPFDFAYTTSALPCQRCASAHLLNFSKHVNNPCRLQPGPLGPPLPHSGEGGSPTIQGFRNCVLLNLLSEEVMSEILRYERTRNSIDNLPRSRCEDHSSMHCAGVQRSDYSNRPSRPRLPNNESPRICASDT